MHSSDLWWPALELPTATRLLTSRPQRSKLYVLISCAEFFIYLYFCRSLTLLNTSIPLDTSLLFPLRPSSPWASTLLSTTRFVLKFTLAGILINSSQPFLYNLSAPFVIQFFNDQLNSVLPYVDVVFSNDDEARVLGEKMGWGVCELTAFGFIYLFICVVGWYQGYCWEVGWIGQGQHQEKQNGCFHPRCQAHRCLPRGQGHWVRCSPRPL